MKAEGSVRIFPTEDPARVLRAIEIIFPSAEISHERGGIIQFETDLTNFINIVDEQEIGRSAAMLLGNNIRDGDPTFYLNKQAALSGIINFTDGSSTLGDIGVRITEEADEFLQTLG